MADEYVVNVPCDVRFLDKTFRKAMLADGKLPKELDAIFTLAYRAAEGVWRLDFKVPGIHGEIAAMRWLSRVNTLRTLLVDPVDKRATTLTFEGLRYTVAAAQDMLARMEAGMSC